MSLVSTWVAAVDGRFYQNPILEGDGWFVCFDDDDPPELVISKTLQKTPQQVLQDAGIPWRSVDKPRDSGERIFKKKWKWAKTCFFELSNPIPVPQRFDAVSDNPTGQGCYYRFTKVRR
jgi:hypothetical protein